ncbi:hypothetical protein KR96_05465 [Ralstonia solanacearum]|nr:hypothetical protein KR96_05465 [Ralstonia solanacearum]
MPQTALSALSGLLGQHTRQITIETALTTDNLVVERFTAKEAVSAPFVLHVDCLSPSAHLDTAKLATEEITQRLMCPMAAGARGMATSSPARRSAVMAASHATG